MWITTAYEPKAEHACVLPIIGSEEMPRRPKGSIWECDQCSQQWELRQWVTPAGTSDFVPEWQTTFKKNNLRSLINDD